MPKQKITAAEKQKEIEALAANMRKQAAQIRKVSGPLENSRPAPRLVSKDR
jgi:hypothetical protein